MDNAKRNLVFLELCATCFMLALLSTALNTALPALSSDLGIPPSIGQWVVSGYALILALVMPLTAFLVRRFPTRSLYIASLAVFFSGTLCCALSTSFHVLMVGRVLQAAANGSIANLTQVTILSMFEKAERGTRMGWFGLSVGVAPIVAPALGGYIVDAFGWRMVFWGAAALASLSIIAALFVITDVLDTSIQQLDVLGFLESAVSLADLTIGFGMIPSMGIANPSVCILIGVGLLSGTAFVRRQRAVESPLIELRILRNQAYRNAVVSSAVLYAIMMGSATVLPVYVQDHLGGSATMAGLVVLPGVAVMAAINPIAGKVYDKWGMRRLVGLSCLLLIGSNALMCIPALNDSLEALVVLTVIRYLAIGLVQMPLVTWGNSNIPKNDLSSGTALLTSLRNAVGAMGVAVFVGLLSNFGVEISYGAMTILSIALLVAFVGDRSSE